MTLNILTLQKEIGDGNASRGFHTENDRLTAAVEHLKGLVQKFSPRADGDPHMQHDVDIMENKLAEAKASLRNYQMTKLALIVTEVAEAVEELRHGKGAAETYYPTSQYNQFRESSDEELALPLNKPEGVPSEIADIVIRCFDFADEAGFDLFAMIEEKLEYNGTRGFRHGGKAV